MHLACCTAPRRTEREHAWLQVTGAKTYRCCPVHVLGLGIEFETGHTSAKAGSGKGGERGCKQ